MNKESKVLILGGRGLVGSSLIRVFKENGYENLMCPSREELDLLDQEVVSEYFKKQLPDVVINAAAKVGGIYANDNFRADFIFENISMQNNLFKASFENNVKELLFLGSSCIYPRECPQPIKEEYLLTGPLEKTNEPYAIAKIAGLKTAEAFRQQYGLNYFSVMPTNLYGVNDNFHPKHSHVIPGLISRMNETIMKNEEVFIAWGSGKPRREFLYVDDLAKACLFLLTTDKELPDWINVGTGQDITIEKLVNLIADKMGFKGKVQFNTDIPDGTPQKLLDVTKINNLGWKFEVELEEGIEKTIEYFRSSETIRSV